MYLHCCRVREGRQYEMLSHWICLYIYNYTAACTTKSQQACPTQRRTRTPTPLFTPPPVFQVLFHLLFSLKFTVFFLGCWQYMLTCLRLPVLLMFLKTEVNWNRENKIKGKKCLVRYHCYYLASADAKFRLSIYELYDSSPLPPNF